MRYIRLFDISCSEVGRGLILGGVNFLVALHACFFNAQSTKIIMSKVTLATQAHSFGGWPTVD